MSGYSPWASGYFGGYATSGLLPGFLLGTMLSPGWDGFGGDGFDSGYDDGGSYDGGGDGGDGGDEGDGGGFGDGGGDAGGDGGGFDFGGDGGGFDFGGGDFGDF